jgi:hypothetical protein
MSYPIIPLEMRYPSEDIEFSDGYKYQLKKDAIFFVPWLVGHFITTEYILVDDGWVLIKRGYAWDGISGPGVDTNSTYRGSLFHDAMYQLLRNELIPRDFKEKADSSFIYYCSEDGMWKVRQVYFHIAVDKFGEKYTTTEYKKEIIIAPKDSKG